MELGKIWGVGPAAAKSLVEQGYTSVAHLRAAMHSLLNPPLERPVTAVSEPVSRCVSASTIAVSETVPENEHEHEHEKQETKEESKEEEATGLLECAPTVPPRCPLTVQQMIGLNRFEDLLERMDRDEVSSPDLIRMQCVDYLQLRVQYVGYLSLPLPSLNLSFLHLRFIYFNFNVHFYLHTHLHVCRHRHAHAPHPLVCTHKHIDTY